MQQKAFDKIQQPLMTKRQNKTKQKAKMYQTKTSKEPL